jgi:PBSX family phage terminase large subunit
MQPYTAANRPYTPFGGASDLFYCKDNEILIEGPAGTGKTRAVLEKVHLCAMKYAGMRALLVRKTRRSITESVLVTLEEKVLPENSSLKAGAGREHRHSYTLPNGSVIVVGGMDNPDRIMSTEYDMICAFESTELTEDDWEKLMTRLRNGVMPYQQGIADCNPGAPTHWLNQRATSGKMRRIYSRHSDNPTVTPEYLQRLSSLTGARKTRLYEGKWASQEGLVYNFDPLIHLIPRFEIPKEWTRYRVIDFGYTNPFVCDWYAVNPDNELFLYRQLYYSERLVSEHAKQILSLSGSERYKATLADHDAEDRATLHKAGIATIPAIKDVQTGIQAVIDRLKVKPNGRPSYFLLEDSLVERDPKLVDSKRPTWVREEFDSYSWPKGANGKEMKEAPVKSDDHAMDTLKYMCKHLMHKPTAPKFHVVRR